MKRIIFVIVLLLLKQQAWAQSSFGNLTKYWWYRYRLVNDFMKIGEGCGESIPASHRYKWHPVIQDNIFLTTFKTNSL